MTNRIVIKKSEMLTNTFEEAVELAFGKGVELVKTVGMPGFAFGTVEVNGKPFDWKVDHESWAFFQA